MIFDYYAFLDGSKACPQQVKEGGLASGFADGCTVWSCRGDKEKNNARQCYMKRAADLELKLPQELQLEPDHGHLPNSTWFGIDVSFTLKSPWYSKDDRPFHVLDNPVRKDHVFGVPFMSSAAWKGLLRWACRMKAGLLGHLEAHGTRMDGWKDPPWILHLFGNEKGASEHFRSGTLVCYPTWFNKVGFEVINPHNRTRRAGMQPIYYEVVPVDTKGRLRLLYAPLPGEIERDRVTPADFIDSLIDSIKALLETYGISAKRTAGWGTARIDTWTGMLKASAQPPKPEPRSTKKTLHSLQDLGTLAREQSPPGSFTSKDAEGFKAEMKSRIAQKGGGQ
ncbi:MAG: RAMP superfamily CRISPR-associated protein [Thermodesulfobacteriota bacterium]